VQGCEEKGEGSVTSSKAQMASDRVLDITNKSSYLCKSHYKEWKKAAKGKRDIERACWALTTSILNLDNINRNSAECVRASRFIYEII
jgi:hypothetical protein